jgi:hypothetical protein
LLHVFEVLVDRVNEAAHRRTIAVEQAEGSGHVGVRKLKTCGVALRPVCVLLKLLLTFCIILRLLGTLYGGWGTCAEGLGVEKELLLVEVSVG